MIYADSSALLKRVMSDADSPAVRWMLRAHNDAGDVIASSSLSWLEVWRSLRRSGSAEMDLDLAASAALSGILEIPLTDDVLTRARRIGAAPLRAVDAIHLTSAIAVGAVSVLTFDSQLADAATPLGFAVLRPRR